MMRLFERNVSIFITPSLSKNSREGTLMYVELQADGVTLSGSEIEVG